MCGGGRACDPLNVILSMLKHCLYWLTFRNVAFLSHYNSQNPQYLIGERWPGDLGSILTHRRVCLVFRYNVAVYVPGRIYSDTLV